MIVPKVYDEVINYVLIPIFIVIFIFGLIIIFASHKDRKDRDPRRQFKVNYWGAIIGIIFGALLLTVSIGFSVAFIEKMYNHHLINTYPWILALLSIFPLIPLGFLIYCIVKFVKLLKHRNEIIVEVE